jgi:MRG-binding protein
MIKWKPTGLHKHFRMISIHNNMRSHGFVTPATPHTRIPGIWAKLDQLYDLSALDERENAYAFSNQPDPNDPDEAPELPEFQLPEDEFGEMMWTRRFHGPESERSSSPAIVPIAEDKALYAPGIGLLHELPEEAKKVKEEAAAASTPTPKPSKAGARSSRAATKGARAKAQAAKNNKAESTPSESGDDDEEEDDERESGESEEETAPTTRKTARGATKPKPPPRRGRKR